MSGGSRDYICWKIENELCDYNGGKGMYDIEITDLAKDFAKLAHSLEWAESGDTCMEDYYKDVEKFKNKWFKSNRENRLKGYINEKIESLKLELERLVGNGN